MGGTGSLSPSGNGHIFSHIFSNLYYISLTEYIVCFVSYVNTPTESATMVPDDYQARVLVYIMVSTNRGFVSISYD